MFSKMHRTSTFTIVCVLLVHVCTTFAANYSMKELKSLKKNPSKDPSKEYGIERYQVTDKKVDDEYEIRVTYNPKCGNEKMPGMTINFIRNNTGEYESFCQFNTHYYIMQMKRDGNKEMYIEKGSVVSADGKSWFKTFLEIEPKVQVRTELKTVSMDNPLVKTYELPFEIVPFEKRKPKVEPMAKSLYKKGEVDRLRMHDLTGEYFTVKVKEGTCGMDREPCLQFTVAYNGHGNSDGKVYLTPKELQKAKKNGEKSEYGIVVKSHTFKKKEWGPGDPMYRVSVDPSKKKVALELKTKAAGLPVVRTYDLPF